MRDVLCEGRERNTGVARYTLYNFSFLTAFLIVGAIGLSFGTAETEAAGPVRRVGARALRVVTAPFRLVSGRGAGCSSGSCR